MTDGIKFIDDTEMEVIGGTNKGARGNTILERWGDAVTTGFAPVPNTLIWAQSRLGISANEMVVILNLASHWWSRVGLPYPRTNTIAKRSGLKPRTVQRCLRSLSNKGFVARIKRQDGRAMYSLEGLRRALENQAPMVMGYRPGLIQADSHSNANGEGAGVQTPRA